MLTKSRFTSLGAAATSLLLVWTGAAWAVGDEATVTSELTFWKAVILGLVEGFTEYLPVSSTGHLLVTNKLLGIGTTAETEAAIETYAIAIQIGAIAAVLVLYRERIMQMLAGITGKSEEGRRVLFAVAAAFTPTAIIGLSAKGFVEDNLFGVTPIATAWIIGGFGILLFTRYSKRLVEGKALDLITLRQAFIIGVCQAIALWPGTSRSLVTIIAAVLVGMSLAAAVEFSFLLGLVTLGAATALSIVTDGADLVDQFGYVNPLVGLAVAFIAAIVSIRFMVDWLQRKSFDLFGYYRILIGLGTFALIAAGTI